jgi:glycosyltransferase involved in cell wall biosynthesis
MYRKNKVAFILDHKLMNYRLPFFEHLASRGYDVTVFHIGDKLTSDLYFKEVICKSKKIFFFEYRKLPNMNIFDIVVCMQNLRILNLWTKTFTPFKKYKLIHWGIGVSSSNGLILKYTLASSLRNFVSFFASAQILYSAFPLSLFIKKVQDKTFIANNTVFNSKPIDCSAIEKKYILFIGSLTKRKGLQILINTFNKLNELNNKKLIIIGNGPEKKALMKFSENFERPQSIIFTGNIKDSKMKEYYFKSAIVCVSPLQAGLSILESFSYGVPFIAFEKAISGGEHLNIKNGYNGFLVNSEEELKSKLSLLINDVKLSSLLGNNSYEYYIEKRQMKHMIDSFVKAFNYVLK